MEEKIHNTFFNDPKIEIINNVTANPEVDSSTIKKLLVDQIHSTVKWREFLIYMHANGIKKFLEIGPGKALTGMTEENFKKKLILIAFQLIR